MGLLLDRSKTGFLNPVNGSVDKLISASDGLMCLKSAIFGARITPASILEGLANVAAAMVGAIIDAVTEVIAERADQIFKSVLSPIKKIEDLIEDLTKALKSLQDIKDKSFKMDNFFKDKQDCSNFAAELMNCLAQSAIEKVSNKVAMKLDKHIGKIADKVSKDSLKANNTIDNYINKHTKFLEKADLQNKLLT